MKEITASEIAQFLGKEIIGSDVLIEQAKSFDDFSDNTVSFLSKKMAIGPSEVKGLVIINKKFDIPKDSMCTFIQSENPRLDFAKILEKFFSRKKIKDLRNHSYIAKSAILEDDVIIGANCYIGENVRIGRGTILNNNIVISEDTVIGGNCYFKSGSIIGEDGFGFDFDENRTPIRIPHIGNVVIQDNVEIGANNTVVRATLGSTLIEENTKTDDHVHIAHNCIVGRNCMITASAELSGSVRVGHDAWIGPNSSIMNKISLGNYSMIGLGSVVTKDIPDFSVFAGSPAKQLGWISINRGKLDLPIESEEILSFSSEGKVYVLDKNKLSIK